MSYYESIEEMDRMMKHDEDIHEQVIWEVISIVDEFFDNSVINVCINEGVISCPMCREHILIPTLDKDTFIIRKCKCSKK